MGVKPRMSQNMMDSSRVSPPSFSFDGSLAMLSTTSGGRYCAKALRTVLRSASVRMNLTRLADAKTRAMFSDGATGSSSQCGTVKAHHDTPMAKQIATTATPAIQKTGTRFTASRTRNPSSAAKPSSAESDQSGRWRKCCVSICSSAWM